MRHAADLLSFVQPSEGCWTWLGHHNRDGYGKYRGNGAHRAVYRRLRGPIPEGLTLDHLCRNRGCVNPAHLEPVSQRENTLRSPVAPAAVNAGKTHCKNGHPLSGDNTYVSRRGHRICRACARAHWQAQREQRRQAA